MANRGTYPKELIAFRSGMTNKSDFHGCLDAGADIGVVACKLTSSQILISLPKHLDNGHKAFIDSGAFTSFRTGEEIDFHMVLRDYESVAEMTDRPENLYVVAPDAVGDQIKTLELLEAYKERLQALIKRGVRLIVPLQVGKLSAPDMLAACVEILATNRFVAGIPSNKAAMGIHECMTLKHHAFHILGKVQGDPEQQERVSALVSGNPNAQISADANWLRSRLDTIRKLTDVSDADPSRSARAKGITLSIKNDLAWGNLAIRHTGHQLDLFSAAA